MVNQRTALHKEVTGIFHDVWTLQVDIIQQQSSVTSTGSLANFQPQPLSLDRFSKKAQSTSNETAAQKASEIPKFDLAELIMAKRRKNASTKRKAPKAIDQKAQTIDPGPETSSDLKGVSNVIDNAQSVLHKTQYTRQQK